MREANHLPGLGLTCTMLSLNPRLIRFVTAYILEAIPTHLATFRKDLPHAAPLQGIYGVHSRGNSSQCFQSKGCVKARICQNLRLDFCGHFCVATGYIS
jgi:hypothetical protein